MGRSSKTTLSRSPASKGTEVGSLPRRSPCNRRKPGAGLSPVKDTPGRPRLCGECGKITTGSLPDNRVLGAYNQFPINDFQAATNEGKGDKTKMQATLQEKELTVRQIAHIVGSLSATCLAVLPAPLHYRGLQAQKIKGLLHHLSYESTVIILLESQSRKDLKWWINHLQEHNGRLIHPKIPEVTIESDASNSGWGARWKDLRTGGQWSRQESQLHINAKELLASFLAL